MKKYAVTFVQYHTYEVKANNKEEAENLAYEVFHLDMHRPATTCWYDDVSVERCEDADE